MTVEYAPIAWGYGRVSTLRQKTSGLSEDSQRKAIVAYCAAQGLDLGGRMIFDPAVSGSVRFRERPEGGKLCGQLRRGDHLVIYSMDRGFRNVRDMLAFLDFCRERGVKLHVVRFLGANAIDLSSPYGECIATIIAAIYQMERMNIKERTARALKERKARGRPVSRFVGYGFRREWDARAQDYRIVPNPEQRRVMKDFFAWYYIGVRGPDGTCRRLGIDHICQHMNRVLKIPNHWSQTRRRGVVTTEWHPDTVRRYIAAEARLRAAEAKEAKDAAASDVPGGG